MSDAPLHMAARISQVNVRVAAAHVETLADAAEPQTKRRLRDVVIRLREVERELGEVLNRG